MIDLLEEKLSQLNKKIDSLDSFINTKEFSGLSDEHNKWIRLQLKDMRAYSIYINEKLAPFKGEQ